MSMVDVPSANSMNTASPGQQDALDVVQGLLGEYGLQSLTLWAWDQIVKGSSANEVLQNLRQTDVWKTRFSGLVERQQKGLAPMSESDAIAYEKQASELFKSAGLPGGFYDSSDDFQKLIGGDVSITELTHRVNDAYLRVVNAPPQVRDAYTQLFGPSGDAAMASVFLDPDVALPALDKQAAAAEYAGTGTQYGFPISRQLATEAGTAGLTSSQIQSGYQKLASIKALFSPTVSEANSAAAGGSAPVTADQGAQSVFGLGANIGQAQQAVDQQTAARQNAFSGGGGVNVSQRGLVGLGSGSSGSTEA